MIIYFPFLHYMIRTYKRELRIIKHSLSHMRYLCTYITKMCPLTGHEAVQRIKWIVDLIDKRIADEEIKIKEIENLILRCTSHRSILNTNYDELCIKLKRESERIEKFITEYEDIVNSIEHYLVQRAECLSVIQDWPAVYTLSSVSSLDDAYLVYDKFADLMARVLGLEDNERPPILVFGFGRTTSRANAKPKYRIIYLPRQARYTLSHIPSIIHEVAHFKTWRLGNSKEREELVKLANCYLMIKCKEHIGDSRLLRVRNECVIDNETRKDVDEFLVSYILDIFLYIINNNLTNLINDKKLIDKIIEHNGSVFTPIDAGIFAKCVENRDSPEESYLYKKMIEDKESLDKLTSINILLYRISEIHDKATEEGRSISTFPSSFIVARDIVYDGFTYSYNEIKKIVTTKSYLITFVKVASDQSDIFDKFNLFVKELEKRLDKTSENENKFSYKLLSSYAVTGWFDYAVLVESDNSKEVIYALEGLAASNVNIINKKEEKEKLIEDLSVTVGITPHVLVHKNSQSRLSEINSLNECPTGHSCGYGFLFINVREHKSSLRKSINLVIDTVLNLVKNNNRINIVKFNNDPAIYEVFGRYDILVILETKTGLNEIIDLIKELKDSLREKGIKIETQTITGHIIRQIRIRDTYSS